jgi:ERCC4-type nuclease
MAHYERDLDGVRVAIGAKTKAAAAALPLLKIIEDTRQQVAMPWPAGIVVEQRTMPEADFTTEKLWSVAAIELKRDDFPAAVGRDRERFDREIERLRPYRWKCVIVAQDITSVYRSTLVHPHALLGSIASWYARADVPVLFVGNDAGAARLIAGLLKRWEERFDEEGRPE